MFDKLLGNLDLGSLAANADQIAEKFGVPAEKVQPIVESLSSKLGQGGDQMAILMEVAQEHGISVDHMKEVFRNFGKEDTENPAEDLAGMLAKGLFGGKS